MIAINCGLFLAYVAIVVAAATDWLHDRLGGFAVAASFLCLLSLYPVLVWALLRERNTGRSSRSP